MKKVEVDRLTRRSTSNLIKNIPRRPILQQGYPSSGRALIPIDAPTVPAPTLGLIEGVVGALVENLKGLSMRGTKRSSHAAGNMDLGEFGDLETVELEPQPLQVPLHRTRVPDIPHKDHKFVAPHAADNIPLPEVALQDRGGLAEDFIPDLVSPGVVDMLEVIQIQY